MSGTSLASGRRSSCVQGHLMRRTLTDPPSQGGRIDPTSPDLASRVIIRAACDFLLVASAEGVRNYGTLKRAMLMTAIMVANVQHITRSAVRNWRYASLDQIPPDSERRPVSILSLAQSVDTPFETAREATVYSPPSRLITRKPQSCCRAR